MLLHPLFMEKGITNLISREHSHEARMCHADLETLFPFASNAEVLIQVRKCISQLVCGSLDSVAGHVGPDSEGKAMV